MATELERLKAGWKEHKNILRNRFNNAQAEAWDELNRFYQRTIWLHDRQFANFCKTAHPIAIPLAKANGRRKVMKILGNAQALHDKKIKRWRDRTTQLCTWEAFLEGQATLCGDDAAIYYLIIAVTQRLNTNSIVINDGSAPAWRERVTRVVNNNPDLGVTIER